MKIPPATAPIVFTCGDPAGVGPEIIARSLAAAPANRENVVAIGPKSWIETLPVPGIATSASLKTGYKISPGNPDETGQRIALEAMEIAAAGCREGKFSGVVTGPVNKSGLAKIGFPFPGQTEFFADRWGGAPVMAFAGGRLKVALATWHIPFAQVPAALTRETLERAVSAAITLAGSAAPRIGVCGLNPHAGEDGILGTDERERLNPILENLRKTGGEKFVGVSDCLPADTIFYRHLRGEFDAVVALYHDQGLAPLKTLEFEQSVNITLGLPHIRTSPDHGTAYDIAGKGIASLASWDNAVRLAKMLQVR